MNDQLGGRAISPETKNSNPDMPGIVRGGIYPCYKRRYTPCWEYSAVYYWKNPDHAKEIGELFPHPNASLGPVGFPKLEQ